MPTGSPPASAGRAGIPWCGATPRSSRRPTSAPQPSTAGPTRHSEREGHAGAGRPVRRRARRRRRRPRLPVRPGHDRRPQGIGAGRHAALGSPATTCGSWPSGPDAPPGRWPTRSWCPGGPLSPLLVGRSLARRFETDSFDLGAVRRAARALGGRPQRRLRGRRHRRPARLPRADGRPLRRPAHGDPPQPPGPPGPVARPPASRRWEPLRPGPGGRPPRPQGPGQAGGGRQPVPWPPWPPSRASAWPRGWPG